MFHLGQGQTGANQKSQTEQDYYMMNNIRVLARWTHGVGCLEVSVSAPKSYFQNVSLLSRSYHVAGFCDKDS
jgi:hypothetical protein